jgi:hypothetical protein
VVIASEGLLLSFGPASLMARRSIEPIASLPLEFIVMTAIRTLFVCALFASAALAASAQTQAAASTAQTQKLPKHKHGAEKNN